MTPSASMIRFFNGVTCSIGSVNNSVEVPAETDIGQQRQDIADVADK
jgi:hypothetical protein